MLSVIEKHFFSLFLLSLFLSLSLLCGLCLLLFRLWEREEGERERERMRGAYQEAVSLSLSFCLILSLSLSLSFSVRFFTMALRECAPWIFKGSHEVTSSEASAVQRLFSSDDPNSLSEAEKEKQLKEKDSSGDLPLHFVAIRAKGKYALSVFRSIFNAYPSAAEEKGSGGWLPLHLVALYMGDGDGGLEAMQLLLTEYPQAAKEKDKYGDLPIHLICRSNSNGATLAMVRALLSAHPQSINEKGYDGMKPYARAVAINSLPADAIEYLRRAEQGERECVSHSHVHTLYTLSVSLSRSLSIPSSLHIEMLSRLFFSPTLSPYAHTLPFFSVHAPYSDTLERRPCAIARLLS